MADETQDRMNPPDHGVMHLLQRLQEKIHTNFSSTLAEKITSSFTLQEEPPPIEATRTVNLLVDSQDPLTNAPEIRTLPAEDVQGGLVNSRVMVTDSLGLVAHPDANGHYLYWEDKPEFALVNAFYYVTFTLRMFERYARRAIPWSFSAPRLIIDPHVGVQANAFYNEQSRLLGFHTYQTHEHKEMSTAQSADIVSHETAHAILDGLRDLWNESFGLGCRAIHESFGDISAVLVALHDDKLIRQVLEWTHDDLRVTNFISEVAENLTANKVIGEAGDTQNPLQSTLYLRNAINHFKAQAFDDLQYVVSNPEVTLSRQEHNYSRVLTGAFYDIFVGIYEQYKQNEAPFVAVHKARSTAGQLLVMAVELSPVGEVDYADFARALLTADDILFRGAYRSILRQTFKDRNILTLSDADQHLASLLALPELTLPPSINNALSAALFLENTLLPALKWSFKEEMLPLNTYRNADGYVYMTFFSTRSITLTGEEFGTYNNATIDVFGGLSFGFNPQDQLVSAIYRPIYDEDIRQIRLTIIDMIANNRIASHLHPLNSIPQPTPKGLFIHAEGSDAKLIKYPTTFDTLPNEIISFGRYLSLWREKDIRNSSE